MTYDDWKTESPEDEYIRLNRPRGKRGQPAPGEDSPEATAYWDQKIDEARER